MLPGRRTRNARREIRCEQALAHNIGVGVNVASYAFWKYGVAEGTHTLKVRCTLGQDRLHPKFSPGGLRLLAGPAYLRTTSVGRTDNCGRLLRFVMSASAIPTSQDSSRLFDDP